MKAGCRVFDSIDQILGEDPSNRGGITCDITSSEAVSVEGGKFVDRDLALSHQPTLSAAKNGCIIND